MTLSYLLESVHEIVLEKISVFVSSARITFSTRYLSQYHKGKLSGILLSSFPFPNANAV